MKTRVPTSLGQGSGYLQHPNPFATHAEIYLIHLDGSGNGDSFKHFVGEVSRSKNDARGMLADFQDMADGYNSKVRNYQKQMADYQRRIADANRQIRSGRRVFVTSKSKSRVIVSGRPSVPAAPKPPASTSLDEISAEREKSLNFISMLNHRATAAMLDERSADEFAAQMKEQYRKLGFVINFF